MTGQSEDRRGEQSPRQDPRIIAVVVTYGDRSRLCYEVVQQALREGVDAVIVVANLSTGSASYERLTWLARDDRVSILGLSRNRGSAEGFRSGILEAASVAEFIWLLDDDNVPEDGCLREQLRLAGVHSTASKHACVFARRVDHEGSTHRFGYPAASSFLYFDIRQRLLSLIRGISRTMPNVDGGQLETDDWSEVPYGPYGGLLVPVEAVANGELPNQQFVLYEDDTEFTWRLRAHGNLLLLANFARIRDLEKVWTDSDINGRIPGPWALLRSGNPTRLFYFSRNRAYFDWHCNRGPTILFVFNASIYMLFILLGVRSRANVNNLLTLIRGITAGIRGDLGHHARYPLLQS